MEAREWTVLLEEIDRRDYQMIIMGWIKDPRLDDFKRLWHTDSYKMLGPTLLDLEMPIPMHNRLDTRRT